MRYRAPGERPDGDAVQRGADMAEHFLVDGVAPSVIGEGPPEAEPPEEDFGRHRAPPRQAYRQPPQHRHEPPTDPIPVIRQPPPEQRQQQAEPRKGLLSRMFRPR